MNLLILLAMWQGAEAWRNQPAEVSLSFSQPADGEMLKLETTLPAEKEPAKTETEMKAFAPVISMMTSSIANTDIALAKVKANNQAHSKAAGPGGISGVPFERGPHGDPDAAQTGLYGIEAMGKSFLYVFDRSDSMNSTFLTTREGRKPLRFNLFDCAKQELQNSLEQLDERHRFHVVFYNHQIHMLFGYRALKNMVDATPFMKSHVDTFLYQLRAVGETRHLPALQRALKYHPDVIFLLTDGEAKDDPSVEDLAHIAKLNQKRTAIHVVQICQEPRIDSSLVQLAKENRGQHRFLNLKQLYEAMQRQTGQPFHID